jgi:superfamily II DNA or RNA helicase
MTYEEFIKSKEIETINDGITFDESELNESMFPYQKDIVTWALRKGRCAIFSDCGTGKTIMQLAWADIICKHTNGKAILICPLSVAEQTRREAVKFGIKTPVKVCRNHADIIQGINITNYEILDHFDADAFNCVVLDESSILKSFTSATRNELIDAFVRTPFKLCCSASPAPNDHSELGNTVEFLGIMSRTEMLATYFIHDGSDTSKWRLKGYGEKKFWEFVATWAVCVRYPADLGYSNDGFVLPQLNLIEHIVESRPTEGWLIARRAETLSERREARRESMDQRVALANDLTQSNDDKWLVWCDLNAESNALHKAISDSQEVVGSDAPDYKAKTAIDFASGDIRVLVSKASIFGFGMNFQNCHNMIFCGISDSYEQFYQAIRRCWRYGQKHDVNVHIIISEAEMNVLENIKRKQADMEKMQNNMVALMRDVTMSEIKHTTRITTDYKPKERMDMPSWMF